MVPGAQLAHGMSGLVEKEPPSHGEQMTAPPEATATVPALHCTHAADDDEPAGEELPAGHPRQVTPLLA